MESPSNETVKQLTEGVSTQARFANKIWLSLAVIAIITVLPAHDMEEPANSGGTGVSPVHGQAAHGSPVSPSNLRSVPPRKMPLGLGEIPGKWFHFVACLVLSVLCIAFCAAHAQSVRVNGLLHRTLNSLPWEDASRLRGVYDAVRAPSLNRVAPLVQIICDQFCPEAASYPKPLRIFTVIYYVYLKLLANLVYLVLPGFAVIVGVYAYSKAGAPVYPCLLNTLVGVFTATATLSLVVEICVEIMWIKKVAVILGRRQTERGTSAQPVEDCNSDVT